MKVSILDMSPLIEQILSNGQDVILAVSGNSMYPILRDGIDSVLLTSNNKKTLKVLDLPLYKRENGQYVLHRIVKVKNGVYSMAGDNQLSIEHPIYKNQIKAVVKGIYRRDRFIPCSNWLYIFYSFVWVLFFKLRPIMFKAGKSVLNFVRRLKGEKR